MSFNHEIISQNLPFSPLLRPCLCPRWLVSRVPVPLLGWAQIRLGAVESNRLVTLRQDMGAILEQSTRIPADYVRNGRRPAV